MDLYYGSFDCCKGAFIAGSLCAEEGRGAAADAPDDAPLAQQPPPQHRNREKPLVLQHPVYTSLFSLSLYILCIASFEFGLLSALQVFTVLPLSDHHSVHARVWPWLRPLFVPTLHALWMLPMYLVIKIQNFLLFEGVDEVVFHRNTGSSPRFVPSVSRRIADGVFSAVMEISLLVQAHLFGFLPVGNLATVIFLMHFSLFYSLNSFYYKWRALGWGLARRLRFVEDNWIYFVGFGMPLAVMTWLPSKFYIRGAISSTFFPFLVAAAHATTRPTGPAWFPLRLLTPSMWVSEAILRKIALLLFARRSRTS